MKKVNDTAIEAEHLEWGVLFDDDSEIFDCEDEDNARFFAEGAGGHVMARHVYETTWAEVAK